MLIEFKTSKNNTYGRRKYLAIDTDKKTFTKEPNKMVIDGIEIKTGDYKQLIIDLEKDGFKEV